MSASSYAPASGAPPSSSVLPTASTAAPIVAVLDNQQGDVPLARFGHTTTYMGGSTVILFGGAIGGTPHAGPSNWPFADSGRYTITNDMYALNLETMEWSRVVADNAPSARAAHAAACVDSMQLVIYGGATGGGSLSTDELYLLDLRKEAPLAWMSVPITGMTPGRRYGHSMVYHKISDGHHKANLIVFGGNDGYVPHPCGRIYNRRKPSCDHCRTRTLTDIWFMDVQRSPFAWNQVSLALNAKSPVPRVYHTAAICRDGPALGMMVGEKGFF